MLILYVMEGDYVNTEEELERDGSDYGVSGAYEVDISLWDYQNSMGNMVDRIIKEHCFFDKPLPPGYTSLED